MISLSYRYEFGRRQRPARSSAFRARRGMRLRAHFRLRDHRPLLRRAISHAARHLDETDRRSSCRAPPAGRRRRGAASRGRDERIDAQRRKQQRRRNAHGLERNLRAPRPCRSARPGRWRAASRASCRARPRSSDGNRAASTTVATCVLSPISATKNAATVTPKIAPPGRGRRRVGVELVGPAAPRSATAKKDSATSHVSTVGRHERTKQVAEEAGERVVGECGDQDAGDDRPRLLEARGEHQSASNWVLSPISPSATTPVETRKASMGTGRIIGWGNLSTGVSPNPVALPPISTMPRPCPTAAHVCPHARHDGGGRSSPRARSRPPVKTAHVEAELVAAKTALVPGEPITVALRLALEKGWHTYWRNPGDSGLPTTLAWTLPPASRPGPIEWPAPQMLPVGPLVNYGYEGEALHLVETSPQRSLAHRRHDGHSRARADWLVCKEVCIPEGADLHACASRWRRPRRRTRAGARISRRRARALPAAARRVACQRDRAAARRSRSRSCRRPGRAAPGADSLLPATQRTGSTRRDRSRSRATATRTCSTLPVAADALGSARPARRRGDGRRRLRRGARGDDRRRGRRQRRAPGRRRRRAPLRARSRARLAAATAMPSTLGARRRVGARRRLDPQSHALRLPGADAQGPGLRDAPRHATDDAARSRRVRGRRRADVRRAGLRRSPRCAPPASSSAGAFSCNRRRSSARSAILFFVLALNLSGVFEFGTAGAVRRHRLDARRIARSTRSAPASSPSSSRRRAPHRSWAPRSASRSRRSDGVDAGHLRRARHRHGVALCPASPGFPDGGDGCPVPVRGSSDSSRCSRFRCTRR